MENLKRFFKTLSRMLDIVAWIIVAISYWLVCSIIFVGLTAATDYPTLFNIMCATAAASLIVPAALWVYANQEVQH